MFNEYLNMGVDFYCVVLHSIRARENNHQDMREEPKYNNNEVICMHLKNKLYMRRGSKIRD